MLEVVIAAVVVVALVWWMIATYNRLVRQRNKVQEAWAGVDVQLQRRSDLIPNLVATVKGYATHEDELFTRVTQARAAMVAAKDAGAADVADNMLTSALRSLFAVAEAYPELKASTNFLRLQDQLGEIEEELSFSRRYYNGAVEQFNTRVQSFPTVLVAGLFGFQVAAFFRAQESATAAPTVGFDR